MIYIDIGTFDGADLPAFLKENYEVHCFEPNPDMNHALSQYEDSCVINHAAAWNEDGVMKLYQRAEGDGNSQGVSLIKEKRNVNHNFTADVPTINIGLYLKRLDKNIDLIKIDAEGAEYKIIESILDHFDHRRIKEWKIEDHAKYIDSDEWTAHKEKVLKRIEDLQINFIKWS